MRNVFILIMLSILAIMLPGLYFHMDNYYIEGASLIITTLSTTAAIFFGLFGNYNHWSSVSREQAKFEKELHTALLTVLENVTNIGFNSSESNEATKKTMVAFEAINKTLESNSLGHELNLNNYRNSKNKALEYCKRPSKRNYQAMEDMIKRLEKNIQKGNLMSANEILSSEAKLRVISFREFNENAIFIFRKTKLNFVSPILFYTKKPDYVEKVKKDLLIILQEEEGTEVKLNDGSYFHLSYELIDFHNISNENRISITYRTKAGTEKQVTLTLNKPLQINI